MENYIYQFGTPFPLSYDVLIWGSKGDLTEPPYSALVNHGCFPPESVPHQSMGLLLVLQLSSNNVNGAKLQYQKQTHRQVGR